MEKFSTQLRHITLRQLIYPFLGLLYMGTVIGIFVSLTSFLYENLDRPFQLDDTATLAALPKINVAQYELIAGKLNLPKTREAAIPVDTTETSPVGAVSSSTPN